MQTRIRIDRARMEDRAALERLLISCGLGTAALDDGRARWAVARLGGLIVGCGCVLLSSTAAVLTLAVSVSHRRRSVGSTLVSVLLDDAAENGVANIYVAAGDAAGFFRRLHWQCISRVEAERIGLRLRGDAQAFTVSLAERALATRAGRPGSARPHELEQSSVN
jgi:N-acetylglutamate synthase-like GNAT family acetyltransferase